MAAGSAQAERLHQRSGATAELQKSDMGSRQLSPNTVWREATRAPPQMLCASVWTKLITSRKHMHCSFSPKALHWPRVHRALFKDGYTFCFFIRIHDHLKGPLHFLSNCCRLSSSRRAGLADASHEGGSGDSAGPRTPTTTGGPPGPNPLRRLPPPYWVLARKCQTMRALRKFCLT